MDVIKFKDLHPDAFAKSYQEWAEGECVYDEWYSSVFEMFIEDGKAKGFEIDGINFSGFCSQGDGACWFGRVDIGVYLKTACDMGDPKYNILAALHDEGWIDACVKIYRSGHYYHDKTMNVDGGIDFFGDDWDSEGPVSVMKSGVYAGAKVYDLFESIGAHVMLSDLADEILDAARDYAVDIYNALEEEYEYLTSEESYIEYCICNDVDFDVCDVED